MTLMTTVIAPVFRPIGLCPDAGGADRIVTCSLPGKLPRQNQGFRIHQSTPGGHDQLPGRPAGLLPLRFVFQKQATGKKTRDDLRLTDQAGLADTVHGLTNHRNWHVLRGPVPTGPLHLVPEKEHPCPRPLDMMIYLVSILSAPGELLLDPFMGSGTTLRAAKDLGRRAIGIEIEEKYCEIAANRLRQGVLKF